MKSFEEIHQEEHNLTERTREPRNRNEVQIVLAKELFTYLFGESKDHNEIMEYWGEAGYSQLFAELEKDPIFINHKRLQGNIFKLTAQDLLSYKNERDLSE